MTPKLTCLSPQQDFSPWWQVGCWVSVSRTKLAAQQHIPELSPPSHPFPGSWEKDILSLSRKQPLSLERDSLHKSLSAKASSLLLQAAAPQLPLSFCTGEEGGPQIPPPFLRGHRLVPQTLKSHPLNYLYLGKRNSNRSAEAGTRRVPLKD